MSKLLLVTVSCPDHWAELQKETHCDSITYITAEHPNSLCEDGLPTLCVFFNDSAEKWLEERDEQYEVVSLTKFI